MQTLFSKLVNIDKKQKKWYIDTQESAYLCTYKIVFMQYN